MRKYNKKQGVTLIEIICALNIIAVFSIFLISVQLNNMRLKLYNKQKIEFIQVLETVKEELLNNMAYEEIRTLNGSNRKYIKGNKLIINEIKNCPIENLFINIGPGESEPYLIMTIIDGPILRVELELHVKLNNNFETICCVFYKGNYS